ncbi:uncharacterized protein LOC111391776 [Olea europaea var. sylvestris]|uniref:uncharacterized protein LOC111391776 n=1 Tax=Olea europaea var. sylvestris TaxID=158386 RepID=UPI000C1D8783|nr:uncharacterized protein LOC111391776 [Olea europaea var. sylvestris]
MSKLVTALLRTFSYANQDSSHNLQLHKLATTLPISHKVCNALFFQEDMTTSPTNCNHTLTYKAASQFGSLPAIWIPLRHRDEYNASTSRVVAPEEWWNQKIKIMLLIFVSL